jgi:toxin HigB-1
MMPAMQVRFPDKKLERLEVEPGDGGFPPEVVSLYRKRLQFVRSATDERDFYGMKSLRYEKLKGRRHGQRSMRLNDQWRLILELGDQGKDRIVVVVAIADYHD